jgi:predicted nucleotidyltransferase
MEKALTQLVGKLKAAFGDRLVSVILYGSAAAGEFHQEFSDLNILCVLRVITPRELAASEPIFRWWREHGNPAPLLLTEQETRQSTDCFPIEFLDMKERRRVLDGVDIIAELEVDNAFYRAQVEHELRAKLLRLRQKAAGVLADRELLLRLMADSVSTFLVLTRHALRLRGVEAATQKREIATQAAAAFSLDAAPFHALLDLREHKVKSKDVDPNTVFQSYLEQIQAVVNAVDQLEK